MFLVLCCGSGPRQGSFTSKLFSTVYYTEVILAPDTSVPKKKIVFIHINGKRLDNCNIIQPVLWVHEIQSTSSLPALDISISALFIFSFFFSLILFPLAGTEWSGIQTLRKQILSVKKGKPHKWMSGTVVALLSWWFSTGQTDNGQKTVSLMETYYAFHCGSCLPGSEPKHNPFISLFSFPISQSFCHYHMTSITPSAACSYLCKPSISLSLSFSLPPSILTPLSSALTTHRPTPRALSSLLHTNYFQLWGNRCNTVPTKSSVKIAEMLVIVELWEEVCRCMCLSLYPKE